MKPSKRLYLQFKTYFWTFLGLVIVLVINLGIAYFKKFLEIIARDYEGQSGLSSVLFWLIYTLTFVASMVTAIVNIILSRIIRILSSVEKH